MFFGQKCDERIKLVEVDADNDVVYIENSISKEKKIEIHKALAKFLSVSLSLFEK